jgi:hypothetical protein
MKKLKKSLALLLTLALVLSLAPAAFAADVAANSITADSSTATVYVGNSTTKNSASLTAIVSPSNYTGNVVWATKDKTIAAFDTSGTEQTTTTLASGSSGKTVATIYGLKAGTTTVIATAGEKTAVFTVTVQDNAVSSIIISDTGNADGKDAPVSSLYMLPGNTKQLYCIATYASGERAVIDPTWSSSSPKIVNYNDSGIISAVGVGNATVTASVPTGAGSTASSSCAVTVSNTPTLSVTSDTGKYTVAAGSTLAFTASSQEGVTLNSTNTVWTTSNSAVAKFGTGSGATTATGSKATVNGIAGGSAVITATYTYTDSNNKTQKATASQTVTVTGGAVKSVKLDDSYLGLYSTGTLTAVSDPVNPTYKSAAWVSSNPYVATVSGTTLSATIYGRSEGSTNITLTVTNEDGAIKTATCKITVTDLSSSNASDQAVIGTNLSLANIASMLTSKFASQYGFAPSSSSTITFSSLGSSSYGTLYTSSSTYVWNTASSGTAYKFSDLSSFTFVPKAVGDYTLPYNIADTANGRSLSGTITISVVSGNLTVNVTLSNSSPYLFGSNVNADGVAAYTAIYNAVYAKYVKACDHIIFANSVSSGSNVGTLYADSAKSSISTSNRTFYYSGSTKLVSGLYFVPASTGTYSRQFTAYDASGNSIGVCDLNIIVPEAAISAFYNMKPNATLNLEQSLFEAWFEGVTGSSYLSYVTLDGVSNYTGTFYNSGTSFIPGSGLKFYSTTYTGTKPVSPSYIGNVSYKAANSSYSTYVNFTCVGGTTASATGITRSGTLCICVTPGSVGNVTYTVKSGSVQTFDSASFTSVYKTATNTTPTTAFRIKIMSLPTTGSLYYNYVSSSNTGTLLTSANCSGFDLYANKSGAAYVIDKVTFVPDSSVGSSSINYAVYNTSGTLLYCGKVVLNSASSSFSTYSEGYTFSVGDFYSSTNTNPIMSVKFGTPSSGTLYYDYAHGTGTYVSPTMKFYTKTARTGEYPITKLTYIPAAGFSGNVTISYTATTNTGAVKTGTITMAVKSKTASTLFNDVTEGNTGSWSANAVDYCATWDLVSGIGTYSFSPAATMNRAMLVSILYSAAGKPAVSGGTKFKDVKSSDYFYNAVIWASANGIVSGMSATSFAPASPVTREQIAVFLYKYAVYSGSGVAATTNLSGYTDSGKISSYAVTAMKWAVASGIISGTSATTLGPRNTTTRAQVVVMLHSYLT